MRLDRIERNGSRKENERPSKGRRLVENQPNEHHEWNDEDAQSQAEAQILPEDLSSAVGMFRYVASHD